MKTFIKNYTTYNSNGDYVEKTGEFVKVSHIIKRKHQTATYRKAVDWCQSNIYIVKGIVFVEETFWKNTRLVGTGIARNTNQSIEQYLGESVYNYIIR
jgi:hypothetical protein